MTYMPFPGMTKAGLPKRGRLGQHPDLYDARQRRNLNETSPFRNGVSESFRNMHVIATPFKTKPWLGLVVREREVSLPGSGGPRKVTHVWKFVIRLACQHWAMSGARDCRFGCEARKRGVESL